MQCLACGCTNPAEARYCLHCGSSLVAVCPRCDTHLPPDAGYCFHCGAALAHEAYSPAQTPVLPASFGQGRYTTIRLVRNVPGQAVYLVHDTALDRAAHLCCITQGTLPEAVHAQLRRLAGQPGIEAGYDGGEEAGRPYLVSALPDGLPLEEVLARAPHHRLPLEQTLRIADHLCRALAHAHGLGLPHGDLTPAVMYIQSDGACRLGGFGPALAAAGAQSSALDNDRAVTAGYLAPEQALDRAPSVGGDLYALGAVLYELVAGQPPFRGDNLVAVISQHLHTAPVAPTWHNPYLPKPLEALILRLLAKDPADRPGSAADVRRELAAIDVLGSSPYRADQRREQAAVNPLDRLATGVFVGREQELGRLRAAFDAARTGQAGVVLLAGEPGIGKTTLAEETATYAQLLDAQALWGRCYEWAGAPAYWPWVQIIRAYTQACEPQRLRAELGGGAADIAQLVPELRDRLPDLPALARMGGEQARFRLFDGIATLLRNATAHQPLLLVLDDLHWADPPSLLLMQFVARELEQARLLIIGTYRDVEVGRRHPLSATLAELARGHRTLRLALQGISAADIERFIVLSTGHEPGPALVDTVQRETEGNPFFVSEVLRLLVTEGRLGRMPGASSLSHGIPESVRDVVGRRLDRLSPACNDALADAAVIGREFTLAILERVNELAPEVLLDALEEAARARLIQVEGIGQRYRFTHALVQETLYAEVSAGRRLRQHAAVGRALEQVHAADLAPYYGELAYHFGRAALGGSVSKAVEYAIQAGDRAMAQLAWESAGQHYEAALHALDLQADPDPVQRCDVLLALGAAHYRTVLDISESPAGRRAYLRAAEIAQALGSFERLARAALGFAGINLARTPGGFQQVQLHEAALALAPPEDSELKARLLGRLSEDYRIIPNTAERSRAMAEEALAMARRLADPAILASVLVAKYIAIWGPDNLAERRSAAAEGWQTGATAGDLYSTMWSQYLSSVGAYEQGDYQGLNQALAALGEHTRQSGTPYFQWLHALCSVGCAIREGSFASAEHAISTLGGDSQALVAVYFRTVFLFLLRREHSRLQELDDALQTVISLAEQATGSFDRHREHIVQLLHMLMLTDAGRSGEAQASYAAFAGRVLDDLPRDAYWLATIALLGEVCTALEDRPRAAQLYELLLPYADRNVAPASSPAYFGPVAYYLGLLATLLAQWEAAARHFEAALTMNARMQARPATVWTQVAFADMLARRAGPGDGEQARLLIEQAGLTAQELGMSRLLTQAELLRTQLEVQPPEETLPYGLSPRELEVLRLIAAGRSDREIAEALFISPRTVTTHVSHIFNKLALSNRAEAAAFAVRHALV